MELNQCLGFCGGTEIENGDTTVWQTEQTGLNSPVYDLARAEGEFDTACDTDNYEVNEYPQAFVSYPASFPSELSDECMPAYAEVLDYCDQIKASSEEVLFWTIKYGDFTSEADVTTAYADEITGETMAYCASEPQNSVLAENGAMLSEVLTEIVNITTRLRLLR